MNSANAESKALDVAQSQILGDQNRSTDDGWPLAVHRGDQDSKRVQNWTIGYACVPTKERKSFAEIVRTGHQDVGDTSPATPVATAATAQQSDCALCDFSAIENLSVRSVLECVFDDAGAELRHSLKTLEFDGAATHAPLICGSSAIADSDANVATCASGLDVAFTKTGAIPGAHMEASDYGAFYQYPSCSNRSSFFDATPTLDDAFDVPRETAPASLLDFVRRQSPSDMSFVGARAFNGLPAPVYPSGAVFVCLNCGEATNVGAYTIQEINSVGSGRRRNKRFRNRGGHTVTHHSRRYNVVGAQPSRFRMSGAGKRKSGYRQETNL